jgi:hypothetical protein
MVAPIFKFRNVKLRLTTTAPTFVYGVVAFSPSFVDRTLASGVVITLNESEVSTVLLTVQISNVTGNSQTGTVPSAQSVNVSAYIQNNSSAIAFNSAVARVLVNSYPLIGQNAFDPLSGNLVMAAHDQLWVQTDVANSCDVTVSLLEIANATSF